MVGVVVSIRTCSLELSRCPPRSSNNYSCNNPNPSLAAYSILNSHSSSCNPPREFHTGV